MTPDDIDTTARTVWGEARGEGFEGMRAVAHVIKNRARRGGWWGATPAAVCRKPWQFSCWNTNDPNAAKLPQLTARDHMFPEAVEAAELVLMTDDPDPTEGATHYHTAAVRPPWSAGKTPCAVIGGHRFFKGIE